MKLLFCILALTLIRLSLMQFALFTQRSLAASLPKADAANNNDNASKMEMPTELNEIFKIVKSMQKQVEDKHKNESLSYPPKDVPELHLYTPEGVPDDCFETAFKCFITELDVLRFEFLLDSYELKYIKIVNINAQKILKLYKQENCKICEEFPEKNTTDFLKDFETLLQKKYTSSPAVTLEVTSQYPP